jgi:hypothetical protein
VATGGAGRHALRAVVGGRPGRQRACPTGISVTPHRFNEGMGRQLTLLDTPRTWRLDEATKAAGRKGIAEARATLEAAAARRAAREADAAADRPASGRRRPAA